MKPRSRRLGWLGLLAASAACTSADIPAIPNEQTLHGEHVTLHASPSIALCPASIAWADAFVEDTAAYLGVQVPTVEYYLYDSQSAPSCPAIDGSGADCTLGDRGVVLATRWVHEHELVHAVAAPLGSAPAFLAEGLAEMLSYRADLLAEAPVSTAPAIEDNLESSVFLRHDLSTVLELYQASASFTRFVVDRYGLDSHLAWYRGVDYWADAGTIRAGFERATGDTLDAALAAWRANPPPSWHAVRERLLECHDPRGVQSVGDDFVLDGDLVCGGPGSAQTPFTENVALDLARGGVYEVRLESSNQAMASYLVECDDRGSTLSLDGGAGVPGDAIVSLLPGRHFVQFEADANSAGQLPTSATRRWSLHRLGEESGTCSSATVIPLTPGLTHYQSSPDRWPGTVDDPVLGPARVVWLQLQSDVAQYVSVWPAAFDSAGPPSPIQIRACSGTCAAPTDCQTYGSASINRVVDPAHPLLLELRAVAAERDQFLDIDAWPM